MTRENGGAKIARTISEIVTEWYSHAVKLDESWESWRELGVKIESPFPEAAWKLFDGYTVSCERELASFHGIGDNHWLHWYRYERGFGESVVKVDGAEYVVDDRISTLVAFLETLAKEVRR